MSVVGGDPNRVPGGGRRRRRRHLTKNHAAGLVILAALGALIFFGDWWAVAGWTLTAVAVVGLVVRAVVQPSRAGHAGGGRTVSDRTVTRR